MDDELIEYLLTIGAIECVGKNNEGESVYIFTKEAQVLVPELYQEHMKDFHMAVFSLWEKNLIKLVFDENGDPLIGLNENSKIVEKTIDLPQNEKEALQEIIISWNKQAEE